MKCVRGDEIWVLEYVREYMMFPSGLVNILVYATRKLHIRTFG